MSSDTIKILPECQTNSALLEEKKPIATQCGERIHAIDAVRGSAMLFVFLSHFAVIYHTALNLPSKYLFAIAMIASPVFLTISGMMLGIFHIAKRDSFPKIKSRYVTRGIFLLTLGKALILTAHVPLAGGWAEAFRWGPITDALGISIIVGPFLVEKLSRKTRAIAGTLLFCLCWIVILSWSPQEYGLLLFKKTLFGPFSSSVHVYADVFPLLPWLAMFVVATSIGDVMGECVRRNKQDMMISKALRFGLIGIAAAGVLFGLRMLLEPVVGGPIGDVVHRLLSPLQKLPPGPAYALFYGGCGFLILFVLMRFREATIVQRYSDIVEVIGRHSLFVFILQYFVYFSLFPMLDIGVTPFWPLYFLFSVAALWCITFLWEKRIRGLISQKPLR